VGLIFGVVRLEFFYLFHIAIDDFSCFVSFSNDKTYFPVKIFETKINLPDISPAAHKIHAPYFTQDQLEQIGTDKRN
jgi:hypothetical protein